MLGIIDGSTDINPVWGLNTSSMAYNAVWAKRPSSQGINVLTTNLRAERLILALVCTTRSLAGSHIFVCLRSAYKVFLDLDHRPKEKPMRCF
jgi:hypothetical protein